MLFKLVKMIYSKVEVIENLCENENDKKSFANLSVGTYWRYIYTRSN